MLHYALRIVLGGYLFCYCSIQAIGKKYSIDYQAKSLEHTVINGESCKKLSGDATFFFKKENVTLIANEAVKYDKKDVIEARGNIKILLKEGEVIYVDSLVCHPEQQIGKLAGNIIYNATNTAFYAQNLKYNHHKGIADFWEQVKLIQGNKTLESQSGQYNDKNKHVTFTQNVILKDDTFTLHCEKVVYNIETQIAYFHGFTKVTHQNGVLTTKTGGTYDMINKHVIFKGSTIESDSFIFKADLLNLYAETEDCIATGNVQLIDKKSNAIITGKEGKYSKKEGKAEIFGTPLMKKPFNEDFIYLMADTFVAMENQKVNNEHDKVESVLFARDNVKLYQESFQGAADLIEYHSFDATVSLPNRPVVWCGEYQITSDAMRIIMRDETIDRMEVNNGVFIVTKDSLGNYNQIKGRAMVANFQKDSISNIKIEGNGECIYFVINDQSELIGMNHAKCSHMDLCMENVDLEQITFHTNPEGIFYPVQKIEENKKKLEGFQWREADRPIKETFIQREIQKNMNTLKK